MFWPPTGRVRDVQFTLTVLTDEGVFHRTCRTIADLRAAAAHLEATLPDFPRRPVRNLPERLRRWLAT